MTRNATRRWYLVHKWTSIVCTAFLLMFCLTGLPLIFHHEIDELTRAPKLEQQVAARPVNLDDLAVRAKAEHPVDAAAATVRKAVPQGKVSFVAWPGTQFSTQHHYMVALSGHTR